MFCGCVRVSGFEADCFFCRVMFVFSRQFDFRPANGSMPLNRWEIDCRLLGCQLPDRTWTGRNFWGYAVHSPGFGYGQRHHVEVTAAKRLAEARRRLSTSLWTSI